MAEVHANSTVGVADVAVRYVADVASSRSSAHRVDTTFDSVALGSVALAIKDGTHGSFKRTDQGVPFLSAKNVSAAGTIDWDASDDRISAADYQGIHKTFRLEAGDLLLTIVGSLGRRAIYRGEHVTFQRSVAYVRPDTANLSEQFLFHWIAHPQFQRELARRSNATAQAGIYLGELAQVSVPNCGLQEQAKIARVLDTLDTAIRQTEAIIAKLKQVKQGLLHDLLTRGIDANGELRPPQSQAPHLYKPSPLGWIPKQWSDRALTDVSTRVTDGTHQAVTTVSNGEGEVPFLFVSCVRDGQIAWDKASNISASDYERISTGREPAAGMVLYTAVGSYGEAADVENCRPFAFQRHIACIYPDPAFVARGFMSLVLNSRGLRRYADRVALGNAQKTVTLGELSRYPFVCPELTEQQEIVRRARAAQQNLAAESSALEKLQLQKSGLMDDLLTGRVRVTPLLGAAATR